MAVTLQQLLKTMVEQGATDLHVTTNTPPQVRINGDLVPLQMPPLRDRIEDLPVLVKTLVKRLENERGDVTIPKPVLDAMQRYRWPGNVRELSNVVERLRVLHPSGRAELSSLPEKILRSSVGISPSGVDVEDTAESDAEERSPGVHLPEEGLDLKEYLSAIELYLIREALDRSDGVVAKAAKLLGLGRTTLVEKMRKYSVQDQGLWRRRAGDGDTHSESA